MVCCGSSTTIRQYVRKERKHSCSDAKLVIFNEINAKYRYLVIFITIKNALFYDFEYLCRNKNK